MPEIPIILSPWAAVVIAAAVYGGGIAGEWLGSKMASTIIPAFLMIIVGAMVAILWWLRSDPSVWWGLAILFISFIIGFLVRAIRKK